MKPTSLIIVAVVVAAVVGVVALRPAKSTTPSESPTRSGSVSAAGAVTSTSATTATPAAAALPRLLDLGATKCIPCKLMAPILEEMKAAYVGVLRVDFIDIWEDRAAGQAHGISSIPTQIFFAPDGKELFRHEGFMAKEDILGQWKSLGYDLKPAPAPAVPTTH